LKYIVKVKATKGHQAKSVTEFHWITLSKKFGTNNLHIYSKTLEYCSEASIEPVDPPALPDEPPWHLKPCSVDTLLINYSMKQDNPELLKTLALEKINYYNNSVHIHTDASKPQLIKPLLHPSNTVLD